MIRKERFQGKATRIFRQNMKKDHSLYTAIT